LSKERENAHVLVNNTIWLFAGKIMSQIISFVVTVLVLRELTVEVFGFYNILTGVVTVIGIFAVDPLLDIFYRYLPELDQLKDFKGLRRLMVLGGGISVSLLLLSLVWLLYFGTSAIDFFNVSQIVSISSAFAVFTVLFSIERILKAALSSLLFHKYLSIFDTLRMLVRSSFLFFILGDLDITLLLVVESISLALFNILATFYLIRKLINKISDTHSLNETFKMRRVVRYGLLSALNGLGTGIVSRTSDYFIISAVSNTYQVGLYSFSFQIYNLIFKVLPLQEFYSVLRPMYFRYFSVKKGSKDISDIYNLIIKIMLPVYTFPVLYFLVFGQSVIELIYDPKYIESYYVTVVVLLSMFTSVLFYPLSLVIMEQEKMEISLYSKITVVFSIVGGIFAMKSFGIIGVAVVTLLGGLSKDLIMFILIKRFVTINFRFKELFKFTIISATTALLFLFFSPTIKNMFVLILVSSFFAIIWGILLIRFTTFNQFEVTVLKKLIETKKTFEKLFQIALYIKQVKFIL